MRKQRQARRRQRARLNQRRCCNRRRLRKKHQCLLLQLDIRMRHLCQLPTRIRRATARPTIVLTPARPTIVLTIWIFKWTCPGAAQCQIVSRFKPRRRTYQGDAACRHRLSVSLRCLPCRDHSRFVQQTAGRLSRYLGCSPQRTSSSVTAWMSTRIRLRWSSCHRRQACAGENVIEDAPRQNCAAQKSLTTTLTLLTRRLARALMLTSKMKFRRHGLLKKGLQKQRRQNPQRPSRQWFQRPSRQLLQRPSHQLLQCPSHQWFQRRLRAPRLPVQILSCPLPRRATQSVNPNCLLF